MIKKFMILFFGVVFVALIAGSIQSISADHLEPSEGIFKDENTVNFIAVHDSNYQVHLQIVIRNNDDHLVNVTESSGTAAYIPHQITDHVFDTLMGKKEIITIDNIKYEKVQYTYTPTFEQRALQLYAIPGDYEIVFESTPEARENMEKLKEFVIWKIHYCATFDGHGFDCIPVFQDLVPAMTLEPHDVAILQWTILREID